MLCIEVVNKEDFGSPEPDLDKALIAIDITPEHSLWEVGHYLEVVG